MLRSTVSLPSSSASSASAGTAVVEVLGTVAERVGEQRAVRRYYVGMPARLTYHVTTPGTTSPRRGTWTNFPSSPRACR